MDNKLIIPYEKSITTRIGQNLSINNIISKSTLERNIQIIGQELEKIKTLFDIEQTYGMTTEAIRKADNGTESIQQINKELNINIQTISGEEEAYYTWLAVKHLIKDKSATVGVCDIGGGSTEVTIVKNEKIIFMKSFPTGVVRIEEEFCLTSDKKNLKNAESKLNKLFDVQLEKPKQLFLSGGTATTTASMLIGAKSYNPSAVEGFKINEEQLNKLLDKLLDSSKEEIKDMLRSDPGRYDVITAGIIMIKTIMQKMQAKETIVTTYGPRHGYLLKKLNLECFEEIIYKLK